MLITENQLDSWVRGNSRDAQGIVVELILRLVAVSCQNPRERRFPLGDSIGQHGPDGILDVEFSFEPFIPEGQSYWEIGTGINAKGKANFDYDSLTKDIPGDIRKKSTFVFVTPLSGRRDWEYSWGAKAQATWLDARRKRQEWKDVRVIDGTKIVDWLNQFLAVDLWLSHKLHGIPPHEIETPAKHWFDINKIEDSIILSPDLFLANREDAIEKLKDVVDETETQLKLISRYPDQITDFISAYVASLEDETRVNVEGRFLFVSSIDGWNRICAESHWSNLILVVDFPLDVNGIDELLFQKAWRAGHAVIYGALEGGMPIKQSVVLHNPRGIQIADALKQAGYNEVQANEYIRKSGKNLRLLLRCLNGTSLKPDWAENQEASDLVVALLLGAWSENHDADITVAEILAEKPYREWKDSIQKVVLRKASPLSCRNGNWKFLPRYEGWYALGTRIFDEDLDRAQKAAISVLREKDPQFELSPDDRFMANIHGKVFQHSRKLRYGFAEMLALLGSHSEAISSCSVDKVKATAILAVRQILEDADWVLWGSLNELLPFLAEAAPEEFLNAVEKSIGQMPCPFTQLFSQETSGISGRNYLTGLLWALEALAWDEKYLVQSSILLGKLAEKDPGRNHLNRPENSLTEIFLPWHPHTVAATRKRIIALKTLQKEVPSVAWRLLLGVLPNQHKSSFGTYKPTWRKIIPDDWDEGFSRQEYFEQIPQYAKLVVSMASQDIKKLGELIGYLDDLPETALLNTIEQLSSKAVLSLPEEERMLLWEELKKFITKHRRFPDAKWVLSGEIILKIENIAEDLTPGNPILRYRRLFKNNEYEIYEENGNWEIQHEMLKERQEQALKDILSDGGIEAIIQFAESVEAPVRVGWSLGPIANSDIDAALSPALLSLDNIQLKALVEGYIGSRQQEIGWSWVDGLDRASWSVAQISQFLCYLPFTNEAWTRATEWLGDFDKEYWEKTNVNPYVSQGDLGFAIDKLLENGRPSAAIDCIDKLRQDGKFLNNIQCVNALIDVVSSDEIPNAMDSYQLVELIKYVQNDPDTSDEDLFRVEWMYLPLLDSNGNSSPRYLEKRLASDPEFFCEVFQHLFRARERIELKNEPTEKEKTFAANVWKLLDGWRIPPGTQFDGSFSREKFVEWLNKVRKMCVEFGHLEVALIFIGQVLFYSPPDPDGLWIDRNIADALNSEDAGGMRNGFYTKLLNSRGAHWIDSTGKPERELAEQYRQKADDVENAGYHRLAITLRNLADTYDRDAERIVEEHKYEDE